MLRIFRKLLLKRKRETEAESSKVLSDKEIGINETQKPNQVDKDLENSEFIPQYNNPYLSKYDFNPEGEYISTKEGISVINIYENKENKLDK